MRPVIFVLVALSLISNATLLTHEQRGAVSLRKAHHRLAERSSLTHPVKRCKPRPLPYKVKTETPTPTPTPEPAPSSTKASTPAGSSSSNSGSKSNNNNNAASFSAGGTLNNLWSDCGASGATKEITSTSGPNGNLWFFNCGIEGAGWKPPYVRADQLISANFETALSDSGSPFKACTPYWDLFRTYAYQNGIPPMLLASIAMQESSCDPNTVGGGGEQGLMQITKEKCGGAPGGNCRDPDFNIRTGAKFFADTLAANGGNVVVTMGRYNGWYEGLTKDKATAARWSSCCRCQNNLDYLHQTFNGWMQNVDIHKLNLGVYFNLAVC